MKNITATGSLYGKVVTIQQISKIAAKKLFESGQEIYFQSSNMYPFGPWQSVCPIKKDDINSFEYNCDSFRWYNCDSERGRYIHFYKVIN